MQVLVVNTGSSSAKLSVVDAADAVVASAGVDPWEGDDEALARALKELVEALEAQAGAAGTAALGAVGHRVVHGGDRFTAPAVIDGPGGEVAAAIEALAPLAPLHQHRALVGIRAAARGPLARLPAVACFDTAFHATLPEAAATYALPGPWRERWGLRRRGFHGLSHAWAARRGAELAGLSPQGARVVTAHLGAGASLCAVAGGRSVDTTMGMTPLEGLVMATRSGTVDPGLLLWLLQEGGLAVGELAEGLTRRAGLAGLAGPTGARSGGDLRAILPAAAAGDPAARLAVEVYVHRARQGVAAMAASLGGIDLLAFTGGAGVNQPELRAGVVAGLGFLGLRVDPHANQSARGDAAIAEASASVACVVVSTREDAQIAREARGALAS